VPMWFLLQKSHRALVGMPFLVFFISGRLSSM
jgi:hypothetical protein